MKITPRIAYTTAALCFMAIGLIYFCQERSPMAGTSYRYVVRHSSEIWRVRWTKASRVEGANLYSAAPPSAVCSFWAPINAQEKDEKSGIVMFRENGSAYAFLPLEGTLPTAVSSSPGGRVLALINDSVRQIEFIAVPELKSLGKIDASGPVLWKDAVSGRAFTKNGGTLSFSMAPHEG